MTNSTEDPLDGLLNHILPRLLPFGIHHNLFHHLHEIEVFIFYLRPPLLPLHVGFAKDVVKLQQRYVNLRQDPRAFDQRISNSCV